MPVLDNSLWSLPSVVDSFEPPGTTRVLMVGGVWVETETTIL